MEKHLMRLFASVKNFHNQKSTCLEVLILHNNIFLNVFYEKLKTLFTLKAQRVLWYSVLIFQKGIYLKPRVLLK